MAAVSEHRPEERIRRLDAPARMPVGVRFAVAGAVGLIVAGGLYLMAVRGDALLADLAAIAALICG